MSEISIIDLASRHAIKSLSLDDEKRKGSEKRNTTENQTDVNSWKFDSAGESIGSGLNLKERGYFAIPQPEIIQNYLVPLSPSLQARILKNRQEITDILSSKPGKRSGFLVVVGPSHLQGIEQAETLRDWVSSIQDFSNILVSVRTNLSKPRLVSLTDDKQSLMPYEIEFGLPRLRSLLLSIAKDCPLVGDITNTITPQYVSDLYSMGIVGSDVVESQLHRELASGVSYPVGFSTTTEEPVLNQVMFNHRLSSALDAMFASAQPHRFLSVTKLGTVAVVGTEGNSDSFVVLPLSSMPSEEEVGSKIKAIYDYPKIGTDSPRVMLDVGKLGDSNYEDVLSLVKRIMNGPAGDKVMGVAIDSGDSYGQGNKQVLYAEKMLHELNSIL
ncbi:Phospho-2-dehydro-3-deoxyheptonate aldolase phenylalanine-inhibited [Meyerozyma sp. JA9]|nr:Phospho-2-dehydro-3-deoxyheptonate aldolase phenylalanine-inhibited [Meyerozyma sp. JA9]